MSDTPKPSTQSCSDGAQLRKITEIVEQKQIKPAVDGRIFSLERADEALQLMAKGLLQGKVLLRP